MSSIEASQDNSESEVQVLEEKSQDGDILRDTQQGLSIQLDSFIIN